MARAFFYRAVLMRAFLLIGLCLVAACTKQPPVPAPVDVAFTVVDDAERTNTCVEPPAFFIAEDEDGWIDAVAEGVACHEGDVKVPPVDFTANIAVAAWWMQAPCLGYTVSVSAVTLAGGTIDVRAAVVKPTGDVCATAVSYPPTFITIRRTPAVTAATRFRFFLDQEVVGTVTEP